jgi:YVTN family beta-propeller protein
MAYYSMVLLSMSVCILILCDSANAQFDENTLESIKNQTGVSSDIAYISMGDSPEFIYGDPHSADIYVANSGSDTISVIDPRKNVVKQTTPVGEHPKFIYGGPRSAAVYVANSGSDSVSLINSKTNEVVAGVTFDIRPFRTGNIVCGVGTGSIDTPTNHLLYATSGTKCTAKPTQGFEFLSWGQNFEGNSTRTINATRFSDSPWNTILDIFGTGLLIILNIKSSFDVAAIYRSIGSF